ncbi:MAG: DUF3616 domain-containing protein [Chloroflexaceae bacterium]|jgi:hypothetical protein|nr:DUF3616 domain-containing protein [Chloroflexaceae bacterium]
MKPCFLLNRVLLRFDDGSQAIHGNLSAVVVDSQGNLWLGSDEGANVERLTLEEPSVYGHHEPFYLGDYIPLFDPQGEVDIEGMAYSNHYLWLTGSHSSKRKRAKGKTQERDLQRLATLETEPNRYILARIPLVHGELHKTCPHPDDPSRQLSAACLQKTAAQNILIEALKDDVHLGPFLTFPLPSKENGFDIEGLAVYQDRVFLGFRGPVLRGWAIILEIALAETEPGGLTLQALGDKGQRYKKHFVDLRGLGIRELTMQGQDLIILAGPTMTLAGAMQIYRLKHPTSLPGDSLSGRMAEGLELVGDLPWANGVDNAEGLTLFPSLAGQQGLLVVYDTPDPLRHPFPNTVYGDVFLLP